MCYARPGPRCAHHSKPAWVKARTDIKAAQESGDTQALLEAKRNEERLRMEYFGTSEGQKFILKHAEKLEANGDPVEAEKLRSLHEEAVEYRVNQMQSLKRKQGISNGLPGATAPPPGFIANQYSQRSLAEPKEAAQPDGSPSSTKGYGISIQSHARSMGDEKGFTEAEMVETFAKPERIYPSGSHAGQHRITGNGLCLVGEFQGNTFRVVTVYLDGVVTRPRQDQLATSEGKEFNDRFQRLGSQSRDGVKARR